MQLGGSGATNGRQRQWFLHHDNAPSHTSLVVQHFISVSSHRNLRISLRVILNVPYSENGPQGATIPNHGGHKMESHGQTPEDSKINLPPVAPTVAGSMEQIYACASALL
jgi:hypothetical protein